MPDEIFVDPTATTASVIKVGDQCYARAESTSTAPNTFEEDIQGEFGNCETCDQSPCADCTACYQIELSYSDGGYFGPYAPTFLTINKMVTTNPENCQWLGKVVRPRNRASRREVADGLRLSDENVFAGAPIGGFYM
jgi:hypothetical protein